jgi:hypothetical protein
LRYKVVANNLRCKIKDYFAGVGINLRFAAVGIISLRRRGYNIFAAVGIRRRGYNIFAAVGITLFAALPLAVWPTRHLVYD